MKRVIVCVVALLVVGVFAVSARAEIPAQCQDLALSAGEIPQPCKDALLLQKLKAAGLPLPAECQNLPPSAGAIPQSCIDKLLEQLPKAASLETDIVRLVTDMAFGPESSTGNLVSLVLNAPEVLNAIGPTVGPNASFIGACDFPNDAAFTQQLGLETLNAATLFSIATATGAVTPIGPTTAFGAETFTGIATDPTDGTIYASSTDIVNSSLYTINAVTGAATRIGPITNSTAMIAIAFDPTGQLFGYDLNVVNTSLIAINKATGAGTIVGLLGFAANFGQGMDFDETDGTCYLFAFNFDTFQAELRTCNTTTGASVLVGPLGSTTPGGLPQMGCGAVATGGIVPIPTLPQWGMILLTLCLLAAATWQLAGQRVLSGAGTVGGGVSMPDRRRWLSSLLLGQAVATCALLVYGVLVGPLVAHDGVGALLSGLLIGVMIECYRRARSG